MFSSKIKGMSIPSVSEEEIKKNMTKEEAIELLLNLGELTNDQVLNYRLRNSIYKVQNNKSYSFMGNNINIYYSENNLERLAA